MNDLIAFETIYEQNKTQFLDDYSTFLRFKSIATDPNYKKDVLNCADWLCEYLLSSGLEVEKWETANAPIVFASDLRAGPEKETLLIYCHYDVQPVDPLNEWISPPFEPTVRNGEIYARGAQDDKGQCFYTLLALKTLLLHYKPLPLNLKFIIEGEEESGSSGLCKLLTEKKQTLKADHLLIVDSGIEEPNTPAITLGARGIICMEASLQEASFDLHSGMAGGIAYNPNRALVELLSKLHNEDGSISIPGFYDSLTEIHPDERTKLSFDFDREVFYQQFGFYPSGMEKELSAKEANWLRPTLEINGIWGGYTGSGFKTVIPATANAKLSCRLVPDQDPDKLTTLIENYLRQHTPKELKLTFTVYEGSGKGFRTTPNARIAKIMAQSYSDVFEKPCQNILIGGSIPIAAALARCAEAEMVLVGLGLPDDHIHAPNEHFGLDRFKKGFLTICRAIQLFS